MITCVEDVATFTALAKIIPVIQYGSQLGRKCLSCENFQLFSSLCFRLWVLLFFWTMRHTHMHVHAVCSPKGHNIKCVFMLAKPSKLILFIWGAILPRLQMISVLSTVRVLCKRMESLRLLLWFPVYCRCTSSATQLLPVIKRLIECTYSSTVHVHTKCLCILGAAWSVHLRTASSSCCGQCPQWWVCAHYSLLLYNTSHPYPPAHIQCLRTVYNWSPYSCTCTMHICMQQHKYTYMVWSLLPNVHVHVCLCMDMV